jgi:hypothetical protein
MAGTVADGFDDAFDGSDVDHVDLESLPVPRDGGADPVRNSGELSLQIGRQGVGALLGANALAEANGIPDNFAVLTVIKLRRRVRQNVNLHDVPIYHVSKWKRKGVTHLTDARAAQPPSPRLTSLSHGAG